MADKTITLYKSLPRTIEIILKGLKCLLNWEIWKRYANRSEYIGRIKTNEPKTIMKLWSMELQSHKKSTQALLSEGKWE
jgi:hypothetical protein